jgi:transglutaminase-like putative cysteine protease
VKSVGALALAVAVIGGAGTARAQGADLPTRTDVYHADYEVNADGTHTESSQWTMTILKAEAIARAKQAQVSFSTSVQKGEIVEAYTRKKDGRRLDVPKDNYQVSTNQGKEAGSPVFSDFTTIAVVFPDVEVGDSVALSYRIVQTEPMFPGHFSVAQRFSKYWAYDDVRIRISVPSALWTQSEAPLLTAVPAREAGGRKVWEWTFQNPVATKWTPEQGGIFTLAEQPGLYFSTFKTYAELVEAYGSRARPKAAVTDRIRKLAEEIAGGQKEPRDQARALYEWILRNVTYSGHCIGVGAVVPHDTDAILDNRMGDCKDRATLLQALLAARGITSVQAIINSGDLYELSRVPVVSELNHVINYLPTLDMYVDATNDQMPFGLLAESLAAKPVLHVDGYADGRRTPPSAHQPNTQQVVTRYVITPDGAATGETKVSLGGHFAVAGRAPFRYMSKDDEAQFVKNVLSSFGQNATGTLTRDDATVLVDKYSYGVTFSVQEMMAAEGSAGLYVHPAFSSPHPVSSYAQAAKQPEMTRDQRCSGGHSSEEYTYEFPKGLKILSVPKDVEAKSEMLSYRATYRLEGNVLTVKRTVDDTPPSNTCTAAQMAEFTRQARLIAKDVMAQVIFQW